jgi:serine/threonine-protein kinase HipA
LAFLDLRDEPPGRFVAERLRLAFAKVIGTFDDFDLLAIVGRSPVGRIRDTGDNGAAHEDVLFQSVTGILAGGHDRGLFSAS